LTQLCDVPSLSLPSIKSALSRLNKKRSELSRNKHHEQIKVNINLQEKVAQLEKELLEAQVTYLGDEDDSQEVSQLKMHLRAKVSEVHSLSSKVESLQKHSKAQSKQVVQLKQELTALQVIFRRDAISQCDQYNLLS